jgi:hypothetical protein
MREGVGLRIVYIVLLICLLGAVYVAGYVYFFGSFRIYGGGVTEDKSRLREYLGVNGAFARPLMTTAEYGSETVYRLRFSPQKTWKVTDDCIAETVGGHHVFCFDEQVEKGGMVINIYPHTEIFDTVPVATRDRLLNYNLASMLRDRFGLSNEKKNQVVDGGVANYIFKW